MPGQRHCAVCWQASSAVLQMAHEGQHHFLSSFNLHLQDVNKAGTEAGQPVSATAGLHSTHTVKEQAATSPVAARAAEAPAAAAAAASSTSAGKPAASSSPSAASPACSAEPQTLSDQSSPVQIVQQEDVGDVDIGDDFPPAPDLDEAKASASAAARAAHPAAKAAAARPAHQAAKAAAAETAVTGAEAAATSAQAGTAAEKAEVGDAASGAAGTWQAADAAPVEAAPPPPPPSAISIQTDTRLHIALFAAWQHNMSFVMSPSA